MSLNHTVSLVLAATALVVAFPSNAATQAPLPAATASSTDLGNGSSALTYWVDRADGRHVVTTVDLNVDGQKGEARHAVARFASVLLPGQAQIISVPAFGTERPRELRIENLGNNVQVSRIDSDVAGKIASNE